MSAYLDLAVLTTLEDDLGDPAVLRETVGLYLGELASRGDEIRAAAQRGDVAALRFRAHSLGSSSALLGGLELSRVCRHLERDDDVDDPAVRGELLTGFNRACGGTGTALESWLSAQGSNR